MKLLEIHKYARSVYLKPRLTMKAIFEYKSYAHFLQDYVEQQKLIKRHWSLSRWAQALGLSTTSSITNIVQGRRPPSQELSHKICDTIPTMTNLEREYFLLLVELEKNQDNPQVLESIKKRMSGLRPSKTFTQINQAHFSKMANWYTYAIREMVNLKNFRRDAEWISRRLNSSVAADEVEKAIECLLEVGLLEQDSSGTLALATAVYETTTDIQSESLKNYHKSVLKLAAEKIDTCLIEERHYNSATISLQKKDLKTAKLFIENARREFVETFDVAEGEEVYQISIQLFPLTKEIEDI